jgi:hypothetical protein
MTTYPKSYMTDAKRDELRKGGLSENFIKAVESNLASEAGDENASRAWLCLAEIPAHFLLTIKHCDGADYVRKLGFNLAPAEAAYGPGWLDDPNI